MRKREYSILGPLELRTDGAPAPLTGRRERAVLALLLLHANETVSADRAIEALWGERPPSTASASLQNAVANLRRILEPERRRGGAGEVLVTRPGGYLLRIAPGELDLERFDELCREGRRALSGGRPGAASSALGEALSLWRGPTLADLAFEAFAQAEIARLDELRLACLEDRIDADLTVGRGGELVGELEAAIAGHPLRERLNGQLMVALYRSGRQAEALEVYRRMRNRLVEELGIEPGRELQELNVRVLKQDPALAAPGTKRLRASLPAPPTAIVGRAAEIRDVTELVLRADVRLVTLTGSGKTRLALEVAAGAIAHFADCVAFVELAATGDPGLVPSAIAQTVGVAERPGEPLAETLKTALADADALFVLDNFEHLLDAAPQLSELLRGAPRLTLLVTSRSCLHLAGEHEYLVPPLELPDLDELPDVDAVRSCEAVTLFAERAQAVRRDFRVTGANARAVAEICVRVDGLPLAIELAAARAKLLSADAVLRRLHDRLRLLTGGARDLPARQQTLRATIDWSHGLLADAEQALLRRLGVFMDGCPAAAAAAVCGHGLGIDALDGLGVLVDRSLLRDDEGPDGEPRFWMLETIREYALERLAEAGEEAALRRRHADWFEALVAGPREEPADEAAWLELADVERPNIRAAVDFLLEAGEGGRAANLTDALVHLWDARGYIEEGRAALEQIGSSPRCPASAAATMLNSASVWAVRQHDYDAARADAERALELANEAGDERARAAALNCAGFVEAGQGNYDRARALFEDSARRARHAGDVTRLAAATNNLGVIAADEGNWTQAVRHHREVLALAQSEGDSHWISLALSNLSCANLELGRIEDASSDAREALALADLIKSPIAISFALRACAALAFERGDLARVTRLIAAAATLEDRTGEELRGSDAQRHERTLAELRAALGEQELERLWLEGRALAVGDVTAYALEPG